MRCPRLVEPAKTGASCIETNDCFDRTNRPIRCTSPRHLYPPPESPPPHNCSRDSESVHGLPHEEPAGPPRVASARQHNTALEQPSLERLAPDPRYALAGPGSAT